VLWSERSDKQRLDVHNGLLLSALWDAAFDCSQRAYPLRAASVAYGRPVGRLV
jgi:hypothetical protein